VARAIRNIKKNCPDKPFSYVSYYRDYQKDSINYLNLNEAIIQTLDTGFAKPADMNIYRLLDFKKNQDFKRTNMTPFYDLPKTEHSNVWFKRVPSAIVGDQYGNELFILLVHDAIRNFDQRSFSYVDTLTQNFIRNHRFSNPTGIYDGSTLLYKIDFIAKRQITGDSILVKGAIFIEPDDYSIHKLEYTASLITSEKKNKDIYNIEIEYGHESGTDSKMRLKYISFNNTFNIADSTDFNFFKVMKLEWWAFRFSPDLAPTIIEIDFNRNIDPVSGKRPENYDITVGKRHAKITGIKIKGHNLFITVKNSNFKSNELDSTFVTYKNIKDIDGNLLNKRRDLEFRQFRELFVQEYNKPIEFKNNCLIEYKPLEQNCISTSDITGRFWMNTPLKAEEKQQDSQNH
jgi:hypothetical protein